MDFAAIVINNISGFLDFCLAPLGISSLARPEQHSAGKAAIPSGRHQPYELSYAGRDNSHAADISAPQSTSGEYGVITEYSYFLRRWPERAPALLCRPMLKSSQSALVVTMTGFGLSEWPVNREGACSR